MVVARTVGGGRFQIGRRIGSGSFGDIHLGTDVQSGEEVAVKLESVRARQPQLLYESKVYGLLAGGRGIPRVHWHGVEGEHNVMVIDLLGPSLEDLFNYCGRKFSLKTVLLLADQMISLIEFVHSKNFLHRDIKPDNFMMGLGTNEKQLHIIDFGLAKRYRNPDTQEHIPYRENKSLTGTARYASVNTHAGIEQSCRDDLEAIGYVLLYFCRGNLPWQGFRGATKEEKYLKIKEKKLETPVEQLCRHVPNEFNAYMTYCQGLAFEDRPSYAFLQMILRDLRDRERHCGDLVYDWDLRDAFERQEQEARFGEAAVESNTLAVKLRR